MRQDIKPLITGRTGYQVNLYGLKKFPEFGLPAFNIDDFYHIYESLRYYCRRDGVSFLAGYSTDDSDWSYVTSIKNGKPGRNKTIIVSDKKVDPHPHLLILGSTDKSGYKTAKDYKESVDKYYMSKGFLTKLCRVRSVPDGKDLWDAVDYIYRQSFPIRSGGDFDFKDYLKKGAYK